MDYFVFNLQLFGDPEPVVVDLTAVKNALTTETTKKAYVVTGEVGSWQDYTDTLPSGAVATLVSGTLSVAVGATPAAVQLKGVTEAELKGVTVASLTALSGGENKKTDITLVDVGTISAATLKFTSKGIVADATAGVTVSNEGVVNGLTAGSTFAVYDSMSDTLGTTYTAATSGLTATGDQFGIYKTVADAEFDIAKVTVTLKAGQDTVEQEVTVSEQTTQKAVTASVPGKLTLAAQNTATTKYYGVTSAGEFATGDPTDTPTGDMAGWFKVVTDINYGAPRAMISFVDKDGNTVQILGDVSIDATALTTVSDIDIVALNIADTATGKVTVEGVTTTADVVIGINTYTKDNKVEGENQVTYTKTYVLGDTKIALNQTGAGPFYFEIKPADGNNHGKQVCTIDTTAVAEDGKDTTKSYFKVTKTVNSTDKTTTYDVSFVAGTDKAPESITSWSGIVVDAAGLETTTGESANKVIITTAGETNGSDSYAVTNAQYGVVVNNSDGKKITSVTREGTETIDVAQSTNKVTLLKEAGTKYYAVTKTDDDFDGNHTVTIGAVAATAPSGSYFKVTNADGKCTVTYVNGGNISLSGLKDKIILDVPEGFTNATAIDITDTTDNPVDYSITGLPAGTVVTGATADKDSITYTTAIYNNVNLDLATLTTGMADGATVYYAIKQGDNTENAKVGYTATYVLDGTKLEAADTTKNIFAITKSGNTYIVNYIPATSDGVALSGATVGGATNINADKITTAGTKIQLDSGDVKQYTATNVVSGGYGTAGGFELGTVAVGETTTFTKADGDAGTLADTNITYLTSSKFTQPEGGISLTETEKVYKVSATTSKGVTTYAIAAADTLGSYKGSYFKVVASDDGKTRTLTYVEGTEGVVSQDTFIANVKDKVKVDATGVTATTIVLTPDNATAKTGINYEVTKVPAGVTVDNVTDTADSVSYVEKSVLTETGNTITLGTEEGTVYYTVTDADGKAVKGIYECTIGTTALTEKPADTVNYFTVKTESGKVKVTYHKASGDGVIAHDLADNTVNLDAKNAAETLVIEVGAADDSSVGVTYNASELTKKQSIAKATGAAEGIPTPTSDYQTSYAVAYTASEVDGITGSGLKLLGNATAGTIKYYTVVRGEVDKGEYTYTVAATGSKPTSGAYFAVTYASDYNTTVSYVNVSGDATLDLSKIGKQITIDASASTASQIDISDSESNKVDYALTGVPAGVTVKGAGSGDTVAKIGGEIVVSAELTLGDEAVAYYVVNESVDKKTGDVTYSLEKLTTGEPSTDDNYITITKTGNDYAINYTQSATSTAYTFGSESELTVDAAGKGNVTTTPGVGSANVVIENATPEKSFTGATSVTYVTGFDWAAGTYYLPIEAAASDVSLDVAAGTTEKNGKYVKITVTETDGVFKVTKTGKVAIADDTKVTDGTDAYTGKVTITAPDKAIKLDGTGLAGTTITNVAKGSTLTAIAENTTITTASLSKDDTLSVNGTTYTAGGGEVTLKAATTGATVYAGVVALGKSDDTVQGSATGAPVVTLTESADGVLVTYASGVVTAITGLATAAEKVTYDGATYIVSGSYIKKFTSDGNVSTWAAAPGADGDVLHLTYYAGSATAPNAVQAGGFAWTDGEYLVKAGTAIEAKGEAQSDISKTDNSEYVLAKVAGNVLTLTMMKNNSVGLPTKADTYTTSSVSVVGGSTAFTYAKEKTDTFAVTLTNVAKESVITVADGDSITTAALAKDENVTVNGVVYEAAITEGTEVLKFAGYALKDGTVKATTATTNGYELADGSNLKCSADVQITMEDGDLVSITNLSDTNETVTITKGNTQTVYKSDSTGKIITKTEKDLTTNEVTTSTITLENKDDNVMAVEAGGSTSTTYTNSFDWNATTATFGYFKLAFNASSGNTEATLVESSTEGTMTDGDTFVKATLTPTTEGTTPTLVSTKLELTVGNIENGKFKEAATTSQLNGAVIAVTVAADAKAVEFANTYGCTVNLTGVTKDSVLTLKKEDTVATVALAADDILTINGQEYKASAAAASGVTFYAKNASDIRVVGAASLYLTDDMATLTGMKDAATEGTTVRFTADDEDPNDGKVAVTFDANGKATAITGLEAGETVETVNGAVTKTYTANETSADIVYVTVKGETDADKNGTFVKDIGTAYTDSIIGSSDGDKVVSKDYTFSWSEATTSEKPAYFLVSDDGSVTVDTNKVTIDHTNYGQTVIQASLDSDKKLTLTKATIGITGAVTPSTDAVTSTEVSALTLAIGGQKVSFVKPSGIELTVTGAGAESTFTGVAKGDQITTTALSAGAFVTVGTHKYTAGVANDTLVIDGEGQAVSGTFMLKTADSDSANLLTAYHKVADVSSLGDDEPVTTKAELTYTKGSGTGTEGANVVIENGLVKSITGMGDGEEVVVKQTTTTKANGTDSIATTTYSAKKDGSVYIVTKQVTDAEGKVTKYTQTFSNDTQNVVKDTGWTITQQTTTTVFDFGATDKGSVGYFKAAYNSTDNNYALAAGTITGQDPATVISGSDTDRYYVRVTASQSVSGAITIKSIELVHLENSGAWTVSNKNLADMTLTIPTGTTGATVALPTDARSYKLTIAAGSKDVITNVQAQDVVTATLTNKGDTLKVNDTVYVAGSASDAVVIKGDGSVTEGVFTVKDAALKEAGKFNTDGTLEVAGDTISYTTTSTDNKDGAIVTVVAGKVTKIEGLKTGESVTITSADGTTVTTYKATSDTAIEKTVAQGGVTETLTATITENADVLTPSYGTTSKFDWGATETGKVGYFAVATGTTPNTVSVAVQDTNQTITPVAASVFARVQVSGDATNGYTISSVKLLSGPTMDDVTASGAATVISIAAPGSLTLADETENRKYTLDITGAKSGQTFAGLSAADTVTTGDLVGGSAVTVNDVTYKNAEKSTMVINGDGTAKTGKFALASGSTIEVNDTTSEDKGNWVVKANKGSEVTVVVTNNVIKSITGMDINETVVATKTDANGVATTYTFTASKPKTGSGILITRTTEANGTKKVETYLAADNGENIVNDDYEPAATGNSITSNLNWTKESGSTGYFQATAVKNSEGEVTGFADAVEVAAQNKDTKIVYSKTSDNLYLQVNTVYDKATNTATITYIKPCMVTEDGTLSDDAIGSAAAFTGTVTITAPSGVALNYSTTTLDVPTGVVANITGAADGSDITIKKGDTLTTATLTAGSDVKVNGSTFTAGASTALKFTANTGSKPILADGTVKAAVGTLTVAGATTADGDDVTVTVAGHDAIVKVTNGVVTAISGQTANGDTVQTATAGGATVLYTYDGKKYDVTTATGITGEVALAALSEGSTLAPFGTGLVSGASSNNITFYNGKLKNGIVKLTADGSITATGSSVTKNDVEDTSDDITVTYDQAATAPQGAAVVTVLNGKITSIKGLAKGETIAISEGTGATAKVTFYKMTEAGTVKMGTGANLAEAQTAANADDAQTAYIAAGGDLMSANFIGGGSQDTLVGQFNWDTAINGRNVGYFAIKESTKGKTATIADQATEVEATAKGTTAKPVTNKYLVASVDENAELSIGALSVTNNGSTTTTAVIDMSTFTAADMVTITAPTTAITYDKGTAPFGVTINKLSAGSRISNLDAGDKVVTNTLAVGESVTFNATTYTAGAKGSLTFVGEGDGVTAGTDNVALLSGTINLNSTSGVAVLSGAAEAKDEGLTDDIHVSTTSATDVVVKVANGVITSITGLTTPGATVLTWNGSTQVGSSAVLYTVLGDSSMIMKQEWTDADGDGTVNETTGVTTSYLNLAKAGNDITKGKYAEAEATAVSDLSFTSEKATFGYVLLTSPTPTGWNDAVSVGAIGSGNTSDLITAGTGGKFNAVPGAYYLQIKATTATKTGVTTINAVDLMQAGATGKLTAVKSNTNTAYTGVLTIDGTVTATPAAYATFNYALPAASKRGWTVNVTNAAIGSTFTNLSDADVVQTADVTNYELTGKTVTVYKANGKTTKVTAKGDGVKLTVVNGDVTKATGFGSNNETISVVITDPVKGLITHDYKAVVKKGVVTITRTATDNEGSKNISTVNMSESEAATLWFDSAGAAYYTPTGGTEQAVTWTTALKDRTVVSDFDWTMDKATVGYFAVGKNNTANVTKAKTTITEKNASTNYIAVEISADGAVKSIKQMKFDTTKTDAAGQDLNPNMGDTTTAFSGKITITAPTAAALQFDRNNVDGTTINNDETTTFEVKGAIAGSVIDNLGNGDTVTTAKLAVGNVVNIDGQVYTAGAAGALGFAHKADADFVTAGTVQLTGDGSNTIGTDIIYIYDGANAVPIQATLGSSITVQASTTNKGETTFTVGGLGENETFTVGEVTYQKSGSTLFKSVDGEVTEVCALTGNTIKSTALTGKAWTAVKATFSDGEDGTEQKSAFGVVTTDLASADKRIAADKKAVEKAGGVYVFSGLDYVLDKYVKADTKTSDKTALKADVVRADADWQVEIGVVTALVGAVYTYQYTSASAIGQAIKVAKDWAVNGSDYADTITGASAGADFIRGGKGNDTIALGGASDTVAFDLNDNHNIVTGYTSGKDKLIIDNGDTTATVAGTYNNNFSVYLDTTGNNVYLYDDVDGDGKYVAANDANSIMLKGMGTGKAVTINGKDFYFGNGTLAKKQTATTAGATFTYAEGAYYYGNDSGKNALKVATDKTKATSKTLGDDVTIDLTAVDADGRNLYNNISTIDASASGNRVVLTAGATDTTLKGGSYQSTLKGGAGNDTIQGGSGQDVFWFDDLGGQDTVKSYTSGKDAVYLGGNDDLQAAGYTVAGDEKGNVVITSGDPTSKLTIAGAANPAKAITVSTDGKVGGESVSYFVGKSGAKASNAFTYVDGAYYVGNKDTNDATGKVLDTLKVTSNYKTAPTAKTEIDLNDNSKYQSIEAVDASAVRVAAKVDSTNAGVVVTANSTNGTLFKASNYSDTFICQSTDKVTNVMQGFSVGDIIQINGLDETQTKAVAAQINSLTKGAGDVKVNDMTLTFKGTKGTATVVTDTNGSRIVMK